MAFTRTSSTPFEPEAGLEEELVPLRETIVSELSARGLARVEFVTNGDRQRELAAKLGTGIDRVQTVARHLGAHGVGSSFLATSDRGLKCYELRFRSRETPTFTLDKVGRHDACHGMYERASGDVFASPGDEVRADGYEALLANGRRVTVANGRALGEPSHIDASSLEDGPYLLLTIPRNGLGRVALIRRSLQISLSSIKSATDRDAHRRALRYVRFGPKFGQSDPTKDISQALTDGTLAPPLEQALKVLSSAYASPGPGAEVNFGDLKSAAVDTAERIEGLVHAAGGVRRGTQIFVPLDPSGPVSELEHLHTIYVSAEAALGGGKGRRPTVPKPGLTKTELDAVRKSLRSIAETQAAIATIEERVSGLGKDKERLSAAGSASDSAASRRLESWKRALEAAKGRLDELSARAQPYLYSAYGYCDLEVGCRERR